MSTYNIIIESNKSTVVTEYVPESKSSDAFQSEAVLEQELIHMLTAQGYEYHTIHNENGLIANLRRQFELLNSHPFIESAWKRFFGNPCQCQSGHWGKNQNHPDRPCKGIAPG